MDFEFSGLQVSCHKVRYSIAYRRESYLISAARKSGSIVDGRTLIINASGRKLHDWQTADFVDVSACLAPGVADFIKIGVISGDGGIFYLSSGKFFDLFQREFFVRKSPKAQVILCVFTSISDFYGRKISAENCD